MNTKEWVELIVVVGSAVGAVLAWFKAERASKLGTSVAMQTVLIEGFKSLIAQLQEQVNAQAQHIINLRKDNQMCEEREDTTNKQMLQLREEIHQLRSQQNKT